ncbi:MAG: hypothetical protein HXY38_11705 [Chloroflexi bacterium]|nr:hypothetical protein [Chloroflexota bacterium]
MRVIDRTPFQDRNGNINPIARLQGAIQFGLSWYSELEAQKRVIAQLDRMLIDKGFVLIRNFTLPEIEVVIPLILIGPGSLSVILVSPVKGEFEAKETEWNIIRNGASTPARRNLIDLLIKLTRAFQKYLDAQKINIPLPVEPVLFLSDPGANVEPVRPAVRIIRSDAIKQFANALSQAAPVLRAEQILSAADLILEPHPQADQPLAAAPQTDERPVSRAQAIFKASQTATPASQPTLLAQTPNAVGTPQAKTAAPAKRKSRGITGRQWLLLAILGILECCVLAGGVYLLFFLQP